MTRFDPSELAAGEDEQRVHLEAARNGAAMVQAIGCAVPLALLVLLAGAALWMV